MPLLRYQSIGVLKLDGIVNIVCRSLLFAALLILFSTSVTFDRNHLTPAFMVDDMIRAIRNNSINSVLSDAQTETRISKGKSTIRFHAHMAPRLSLRGGGQDYVSLFWKPFASSESIIFLKTHKTAGSSLGGIFWRNLCLRDGRNCFLPPAKNPGRTWDLSVQRDWHAVQSGASTLPAARFPYDAWLSHVHYHPRLFHAVKNASRILSIIRRPALRFTSAWKWYQHEQKFQLTLPEFVHAVKNGDNWHTFWRRQPALSDFKYRTGLEATTEELSGQQGFAAQSKSSQIQYFEELMERMRSGTLILLVTDRFDESLLVLAKLMGWGYEQLVYVRLKVAPDKNVVSENLIQDLDDIQPYDFALWRLANHILDLQIAHYFQNSYHFQKELYDFQQLNHKTIAQCHSSEEKFVANGIFKDKRNLKYCEEIFRDNSDAVHFAWKNRIE